MGLASWVSGGGSAGSALTGNGPVALAGPAQCAVTSLPLPGTYITTAGTIDNFYTHVKINNKIGTLTITLFVPRLGVAAGMSVTVAPGVIGWFSNTTGSLAVVPGDELRISYTCTAGSAALSFTLDEYGCRFSTPGVSLTTLSARQAPVTADISPAQPLCAFVGQVNASAFEDEREFHCAAPGTLQSLCVYIDENGRTTDTVFTLRKNGADTGLTVTVPAGTGAQWFTQDNPAATVGVVASDVFSVRATFGDAGTDFIDVDAVQVDFVSADGIITGGLGQQARTWAGSTEYLQMCGTNQGAPSNIYTSRILTPCRLTAIEVYVPSNSFTGTKLLRLYHNGVAVLSKTIPARGTGWFSVTGAVDIDPIDVLYVALENGDPGLGTLQYGIVDWFGIDLSSVPIGPSCSPFALPAGTDSGGGDGCPVAGLPGVDSGGGTGCVLGVL